MKIDLTTVVNRSNRWLIMALKSSRNLEHYIL